MNNQVPTSGNEEYLARFADRLATDSQFMASVLRRYRQQEGVTESALAVQLGVSPAMYTRLAMCKRPSAVRPGFAEQVKQIAAYVGCDPYLLAQLINQVDSLATIQPTARTEPSQANAPRTASVGLGWLAAARDRTETDQHAGETADEPEGDAPPEPE